MKTGFFVGFGFGLFALLFPWIPVYRFDGTPKESLFGILLHAVEQVALPSEGILIVGVTVVTGLLLLGFLGAFIGGLGRNRND